MHEQTSITFALNKTKKLKNLGGLLDQDALPHLAKLQQTYLYSAGLRIAGGTDEILRNIIAERVLGLPGDKRPDKNIPFNELHKVAG